MLSGIIIVAVPRPRITIEPLTLKFEPGPDIPALYETDTDTRIGLPVEFVYVVLNVLEGVCQVWL